MYAITRNKVVKCQKLPAEVRQADPGVEDEGKVTAAAEATAAVPRAAAAAEHVILRVRTCAVGVAVDVVVSLSGLRQ
jgi:hypothetical protein